MTREIPFEFHKFWSYLLTAIRSEKMLRIHIAALAICFCLAAIETSALTIRDQYWPANSDGQWDFGGQVPGILIPITIDGKLERIELYMNAGHFGGFPPGDLQWWINPVSYSSIGTPTPATGPILASGIIPGSEFVLLPDIKPMRIDTIDFDLNFQAGEYFVLAISGSTPQTHRLLSYRGIGAPDSLYQFVRGTWQKVPQYLDYSPGYSTFVQIVPEPQTQKLGVLVLAVLFIYQNGFRRPTRNSPPAATRRHSH